jgi:Fe-S cluster assembly ATP-binding protein
LCRALTRWAGAAVQRLLDYIKPDLVHIMQAGAIVRTGDMSLVDQLEVGGYATLQ